MIRKILALAAVLLPATAWWYFHPRQFSTPYLAGANVLLITIDTTRPDYLSCYTGKNPTPHIDSIAKKGILFENAFAQVPLTFPSHVSILSGLYPIHHGTHNNGLEILQNRETLISHLLRSNGYKTGAVVASFVLDRKFGLADHFDFYDDRMERKPGITTQFEVERPADEVFRSAVRILEQFGKTRWFLWLHFYDPHAPYSPPAPFSDYGGEIRFVDLQIGKLLEWLRIRKLDENLILAFLGDHGESLGEHGEVTHGFFVYNSTLTIPFLLSYPGVKPKRVSTPVASVDLTPTLLEMLGLKDSQHRDGESLWKVLNGKSRSTDIYFESRYPELLGWNGLQGVIRNNWKLIATTRSELYDWQADSQEKTNLYATRENLARDLKKGLETYRSQSKTTETTTDSETLERLRSLGYIASTGASIKKQADPKDKITIWADYEKIALLKLSGKKEEARRQLMRLAEKESENFFFRIALAAEYRESKEYNKAIEELMRAIELEPTNASTYYELAVVMRDAKNFGEAFKAIQTAIRLDADRSEFHNIYGMLLIDSRKFAEAEKEFQQVLSIDPNNAVAWNNLGNALTELGRLQEAEKAYRNSMELSPSYAYPFNGLATVLIRANRTKEALPYLEKAIELDPQFIEVYLNLGIAYDTLGETDKARTLYKTFLQIAPDWMVQQKNHARLLLSRIAPDSRKSYKNSKF